MAVGHASAFHCVTQTIQEWPSAEVLPTHLPNRLHCNPDFPEIQVQQLDDVDAGNVATHVIDSNGAFD